MTRGRSWPVVLGALVVNALLQALLVLPDPTPTWSVTFVLGVLASALVWYLAYAMVVAASTRTGLAAGLRSLRFAAWTIGLVVVVALTLIPWWGLIGYAVLAVTPYVPIAAMSTAGNALLSNLAAIRRAPWGWAWRVLAFAFLLLLAWVAMAFTAFFIPGWVSAAANSLLVGLLLWLVTHSFAREYRRAP